MQNISVQETKFLYFWYYKHFFFLFWKVDFEDGIWGYDHSSFVRYCKYTCKSSQNTIRIGNVIEFWPDSVWVVCSQISVNLGGVWNLFLIPGISSFFYCQFLLIYFCFFIISLYRVLFLFIDIMTTNWNNSYSYCDEFTLAEHQVPTKTLFTAFLSWTEERKI